MDKLVLNLSNISLKIIELFFDILAIYNNKT